MLRSDARVLTWSLKQAISCSACLVSMLSGQEIRARAESLSSCDAACDGNSEIRGSGLLFRPLAPQPGMPVPFARHESKSPQLSDHAKMITFPSTPSCEELHGSAVAEIAYWGLLRCRRVSRISQGGFKEAMREMSGRLGSGLAPHWYVKPWDTLRCSVACVTDTCICEPRLCQHSGSFIFIIALLHPGNDAQVASKGLGSQVHSTLLRVGHCKAQFFWHFKVLQPQPRRWHAYKPRQASA